MRSEARNNLMIGIVTTLIERPEVYDRKVMIAVEERGAVVAAAVDTPPFAPVLSDFAPAGQGDEAIAGVVVAALLEELGTLEGITGNVPFAECAARAWSRRTGGSHRRRTALGVFECDQVAAPVGVEGRARPATEADRDLVLAWQDAFSSEAHQRAPNEVMVRNATSRLRREGSAGIDLWDRGGEPVSLLGFAASTPNGARIGPVYTPQEHRRHGYAGALVAATTARLLAEGRRFCFLSTNLANPTSNHIYQAIGYRRVCTAEELDFQPRNGY